MWLAVKESGGYEGRLCSGHGMAVPARDRCFGAYRVFDKDKPTAVNVTDIATSAEETDDGLYHDDVPTVNYDGYVFRVYSRDDDGLTATSPSKHRTARL